MPRKRDGGPLKGEEWCSTKCGCGHSPGAYLHHYTMLDCGKCGTRYWALRPLRNGPLQLFLHPGFGDRRVLFTQH